MRGRIILGYSERYVTFGSPAISTPHDRSEATFSLFLCDELCCLPSGIAPEMPFLEGELSSLGLPILLPGFLVLLAPSL